MREGGTGRAHQQERVMLVVVVLMWVERLVLTVANISTVVGHSVLPGNYIIQLIITIITPLSLVRPRPATQISAEDGDNLMCDARTLSTIKMS